MNSHFVTVDSVKFHVLVAGPDHGPGSGGPAAPTPVVLLHGWPQTSNCWRDIIPTLGEDHRVIAPDLRGYGLSEKPITGFDKRTMAADVLEIMNTLGLERAHIVDHDRGARVAHRLALDAGDRVASLSVLDIAPTHAMFTSGRMRTAEGFFHWLLHMQKDLPESLTSGRTGEYLRYFFERWTHRRDRIDPFIDEYVRAYEQPGAMRAAFDDYRATAVDVAQDEVDQSEGHLVDSPVLALWGAEGLAAKTDVEGVWNRYATDVSARAIAECGHFIAEEAPEVLLTELEEFWANID